MPQTLNDKIIKIERRLRSVEGTTSSSSNRQIGFGINFPTNVSAYELFFRTDLHTLFYYDSDLSLWLSVDVRTLQFNIVFERPNTNRLHLAAISPRDDIVVVETGLILTKFGNHTSTRNWNININLIKNNTTTQFLLVNSFFDFTNITNNRLRRYRDQTPRIISGDSGVRVNVQEIGNAGRISVSPSLHYRTIGV